MPLELIEGDITTISVDAVVNAAATSLQRGGGVSGAIFAAAGSEQLQRECDRIGGCPVGQAVITGAYRLPAKYIIHTVGPRWEGGNAGEARLLYNCYSNSLRLAKQRGCQSIAFPLISSGTYRYPKDQALQIAVSAINDFLKDQEMAVYLVLRDLKSVRLPGNLSGKPVIPLDE